MEEMLNVIRQMIILSDEEAGMLLSFCRRKAYKKKATLSYPGKDADTVFFIVKGLIRVTVTDLDGIEHTIHFAIENQFICDYSSFLEEKPSNYRLETLEPTEVIELPREAINRGYRELKYGEKFGRLIAEFYFLYLDNRIKNLYTRSAKDRYDDISITFPNIHNRVPQHMIASYLGITPVHLSRLKRDRRKS